MKAELDALAARLVAAAGSPAVAFVVAAPKDQLPPYYLLEPVAAPDSAVDRRLAASDPGVVVDVRVLSVGGSASAAFALARKGKADLSPDGAPTAVAVAGRYVEVAHERFEAAYPDDSITLPNTNKHPVVVVETYRVSSQPTA